MMLHFIVVLGIVGASFGLPLLNIDGFTWAENLVFDGNGNLFVSDTVKGEVYKIELCQNATSYCKSVYLHGGLKGIGGMQVSEDGNTLYAGVTMDDKSTSIISAPTTTKVGPGAYSVLLKTTHQPNGLAFDSIHNIFYYCDEKSESIYAVNAVTNTESVLKSDVKGADGLWLNTNNGKLYAGELYSKKIHVFDTISTDSPAYVGVFNGLSSLGLGSMMDDITIANPSPAISSPAIEQLYGCDFLGKSIQLFALDGSTVKTVDISAATNGAVTSLYNPTSVRYGKGPGFDKSSLYITEGGGITKRTTNRRVIQLKI